jgi:hypothetical protein
LTMIGREYDSALTALQHCVIKLSLLGATLLCHREKGTGHWPGAP